MEIPQRRAGSGGCWQSTAHPARVDRRTFPNTTRNQIAIDPAVENTTHTSLLDDVEVLISAESWVRFGIGHVVCDWGKELRCVWSPSCIESSSCRRKEPARPPCNPYPSFLGRSEPKHLPVESGTIQQKTRTREAAAFWALTARSGFIFVLAAETLGV